MSYTERYTEVHCPLASYNADSLGVSTNTSAYVSLRDYHRAILVLNVGDMGQAATLDCQILQATTTAGAGSKVITKAITQLTQAGGDGNGLIAIELKTEELDVTNRFDCVAVQVVIGGAAVEMSYVLYGIISRFEAVAVTAWTEVID